VKQWLTLLDAYFSECLGCDIGTVGPDETRVSASSRRERRELHYADVFPVWCFVTQNRCVVSVQRPLLSAVSRLVSRWDGPQLRNETAAERLTATAAEELSLGSDASYAAGPVLFCPPETYRGARLRPCRAVAEADRPALDSAGLLDSSLIESVADGTCFVGFDGDRPVALCGVCPVPHMADRVADVSLNGTLEAFRHQGFGRTVLSAVTETVHARGRLPFYITSDRNVASRRTAASVGYVEYGWQIRVMMPVKD
jgi:GNAT superfamily N-acetyltransferase